MVTSVGDTFSPVYRYIDIPTAIDFNSAVIEKLGSTVYVCILAIIRAGVSLITHHLLY